MFEDKWLFSIEGVFPFPVTLKSSIYLLLV